MDGAVELLDPLFAEASFLGLSVHIGGEHEGAALHLACQQCAELLVALECVLDSATLERLLAEGKASTEKRYVR
jgi:hypothetical protein